MSFYMTVKETWMAYKVYPMNVSDFIMNPKLFIFCAFIKWCVHQVDIDISYFKLSKGCDSL